MNWLALYFGYAVSAVLATRPDLVWGARDLVGPVEAEEPALLGRAA